MDDDSDALMNIGTFARRVGLAPSALRFYDDCGVLPPVRVDGVTGYRYYAPGQEARAVLVRRMREAGMPLTDVCQVLDGSGERARAVLEAHVRRVRETAEAARSAVEEILRDLLDLEGAGGPVGGGRGARARIGGAELAGAVRQVAPAAADPAVCEEFPVLGCVLVELDGQEVRLVATDRYRLAVRALRPSSSAGEPRRILVRVPDLREAAAWALRRAEAVVEIGPGGARLRDGDAPDESWELPAVPGTFPDYRQVLDALPAVRHRIVTDRAALGAALAEVEAEAGGPVTVRAGRDRLALVPRGSGARELAAVCTGAPVPRVAFDPGVLLPAVEAGVGPDVLLEFASPDLPVLVRSADQGSFSTLVMPVRADPADG
ncbi:MerR family transcriptional regulator [Streptomyces leeuwenhoekii]|uniref:MerR Family Transcriptional Regulator n=1 Tax=Streptomyces leeuwenhoekii TaxID=1437453 RepID=A0A0F7VTX9_STRLW|nr:MerR family transcriptional regulator [Streptomyces leeuwenhoekii]CQR63155.1 MerR Family Transcriptional Regulator [Streptomyces leeuwenhoekii]